MKIFDEIPDRSFEVLSKFPNYLINKENWKHL